MKLERTIDLPQMVAYAGATWDWHRLHYDGEFIERMGVRAPVVDGQMLGGLLATMLADHFGEHAFITRMSIRYKAMVHAGQTVLCEGNVTDAADGEVTVEVTVTAGDTLAVVGSATVRTPEED